MLRCSARGRSASTASICLSTGTDSPVRADSFTCKLAASNKRRSAVTTSPLSNMTISPGTSSSASISCANPSRRTFVRTSPISCRASIERTACSSVEKPIRALIRTTAIMATLSMVSPKRKAMAAAANRSKTTRLLNWSKNIRQTLRRLAWRRRLRPNWSRRCETVALSRPLSGFTSRVSTISCGVSDQGLGGNAMFFIRLKG
jgi:hypothetical protein